MAMEGFEVKRDASVRTSSRQQIGLSGLSTFPVDMSAEGFSPDFHPLAFMDVRFDSRGLVLATLNRRLGPIRGIRYGASASNRRRPH
jgi:hypothetical protein